MAKIAMSLLLLSLASSGLMGCSQHSEELETFCQELRRVATTHKGDCDAMSQELHELTEANTELVKAFRHADSMSDDERRAWNEARSSCVDGLVTITAVCPAHPGVEDAFRVLQ